MGSILVALVGFLILWKATILRRSMPDDFIISASSLVEREGWPEMLHLVSNPFLTDGPLVFDRGKASDEAIPNEPRVCLQTILTFAIHSHLPASGTAFHSPA